MRRIDDDIGIRRVVNGRDLAVADAERFMHDLNDRREAIGGAGGRRQQPMLARVIAVIIDADHDVERRRILDRRRDDDAAHAAIEIALQLIRFQKFAGAFEHDLNAEITPWHFAGHRRIRETNAPVADQDRAVAIAADVLPPAAMQAVEFEQMGGHAGIALHFVDMHDLEPIAGARIVGRPFHPAQRRAGHRSGTIASPCPRPSCLRPHHAGGPAIG